MRFRWRFPSPRDSSLNPNDLPKQVSLLRSTGPPHPSGYWRFYRTPRSTGVLYSSSWLQTWFKYSNMKLSFVSRPDVATTLILCISSLSLADKNYYKRWWSICHSTSGLKYQKMGKCTSKMPQLFMSWGIRSIFFYLYIPLEISKTIHSIHVKTIR